MNQVFKEISYVLLVDIIRPESKGRQHRPTPRVKFSSGVVIQNNENIITLGAAKFDFPPLSLESSLDRYIIDIPTNIKQYNGKLFNDKNRF